MLNVVASVLPQMVGVVIAPANMIIVIVLLSTKGGMRKASIITIAGFISAMAYTWGTHFLGATESSSSGTPVWQGWFEVLAGVVFAYLVIGQVRAMIDPKPGGPAWLKSLDTLGFIQTIAVGIYIGAINIKNIPLLMHAGLEAGNAKLDPTAMIVYCAIIALIAVVPALVPLLISAVSGEPGKKLLADLREFLEKHSPAIMATLFTIFAALFIGKGIEIVLH